MVLLLGVDIMCFYKKPYKTIAYMFGVLIAKAALSINNTLDE